jgi:hypothetical protein
MGGLSLRSDRRKKLSLSISLSYLLGVRIRLSEKLPKMLLNAAFR